ncbi:MAG: benzoate--CoA ligase [Alphaproteobacteria bacterium]|nr:MAG: benzoate--CoA ligase [Alphaproteobacteria bacterium]
MRDHAPSLFDQGPPPPCPAPFNLAAEVLATAEVEPGRPALEVIGADGPELTLTHGQLRDRVARAAAALRAAGLAPGARLVLRLGNDPAFPVAFLGAIWAGIVPVPVSAELTAAELAAMLPAVAPAAVLADPALPLPPLELPVLAPAALAAPAARLPDPETGDPDRPAYAVFTSGTSGRPRAVLHAHRALWARRMMWEGWYGLRPDERMLHAGAFNWTYTLGTGLLDPWTIGATALIPAPGLGRAALAAAIGRRGATIFAAAPGVYRQLLATGALGPAPALRHGLSAGEKMAESLRRRWTEATGTPVFEALGMSECSTFVSSSPARPPRPGIAGYPQPGRRVAVLGPDHRPVPRGTPGQLAVSRRDPGLALGYLDADAEWRARLAGEWFLTGDEVVMEADDAIRFLGRMDDMLNAGGFRVSPLEIEAALAAHPAVAEAAAIELPLSEETRIIAAVVVPADPADPPAAEALAAHAAGRLARYKRPRRYLLAAALPRGAHNKLARRRVRDLAIAGRLTHLGDIRP